MTTVVSAAVRGPQGIFSVVAPGRHHTIIHAMAEFGYHAYLTDGYEQGFFDSEGRFLTRPRALVIAHHAGQIIRGPHMPCTGLDTSDLW